MTDMELDALMTKHNFGVDVFTFDGKYRLQPFSKLKNRRFFSIALLSNPPHYMSMVPNGKKRSLARVDMGVEHFIKKRQRVEKVVVDM